MGSERGDGVSSEGREEEGREEIRNKLAMWIDKS